MQHYRYLIVGGGMTAAAALAGIRSVDPSGTVGLIASETHPPYNRPPLSKGLWKGTPLEKIWRHVESEGVELRLGRQAVELDPAAKLVRDADGQEYAYDRLLLATGGTPDRLPFGGDEVIYYRYLDDYLKLHRLAEKPGSFGLIGGGFIGSEVAAALRMNGHRVTMLFPEDHVCAHIFPADLARYVTNYYQDHGVQMLSGRMVTGITPQTVDGQDKVAVATRQGDQIQVDAVIAGIGIRPNTELAKNAGLEIDNGVVVDEFLRTSQAEIYAAGDVASFYNPNLGKRIRVEHEDNANMMGRRAGENMAGEPAAYHHLPYFYSDLFDLGYEAVGELDSSLEVFIDWQEPYHKGVLYYLQESQVRGVLLWNVWGKVEHARQLIGRTLPGQPAARKEALLNVE